MSPKQVVVIVDGGILSAIPQAFTRYSANDRQFPVNDRSLFTGKSRVGEGSPRPNGLADTEKRGWLPPKVRRHEVVPIFSLQVGLTEKGAETHHGKLCSFQSARAAIADARVPCFY